MSMCRYAGKMCRCAKISQLQMAVASTSRSLDLACIKLLVEGAKDGRTLTPIVRGVGFSPTWCYTFPW